MAGYAYGTEPTYDCCLPRVSVVIVVVVIVVASAMIATIQDTKIACALITTLMMVITIMILTCLFGHSLCSPRKASLAGEISPPLPYRL
jgi:hypothetical protein